MALHEHSTMAVDPAEHEQIHECECGEMMWESERECHRETECPLLHGCDVCAEPAVIRDDGEAYCVVHAAELVRFAMGRVA